MSRLSPVQMVRSAKLVMVPTEWAESNFGRVHIGSLPFLMGGVTGVSKGFARIPAQGREKWQTCTQSLPSGSR